MTLARKIRHIYNRLSIWWLMRQVNRDLQKIHKDLDDKVSREHQSL